ncbi:hypothetical protein [Pseudomonas iridis]|uniref:hypothetical protein n=1 Tax=Pseudomonas iridis TaxID=2710587 RepID=UPI001B33C0F4|nr:hypothetical protein [Pseudomonas iridis]MBP5966792.1 hypothetical protein [Pseudomonas iridis]
MSTSLSLIDLNVIEGEILRGVLVSPEDMARMNEARAVFNELRSILLAQVVPALGGGTNPMATEIEARLEAITFASRNFLWPHRHAGAAHDAVNVEACR